MKGLAGKKHTRLAFGNIAEGLEKAVICLFLKQIRIMQVMVFSVTIYGSESWVLKKQDREQIDAF